MTCTRECWDSLTDQRYTHCIKCHQTFGGVGGFDQHQTGIESVECRQPPFRGLKNREGVWVRSYGENG